MHFFLFFVMLLIFFFSLFPQLMSMHSTTMARLEQHLQLLDKPEVRFWKEAFTDSLATNISDLPRTVLTELHCEVLQCVDRVRKRQATSSGDSPAISVPPQRAVGSGVGFVTTAPSDQLSAIASTSSAPTLGPLMMPPQHQPYYMQHPFVYPSPVVHPGQGQNIIRVPTPILPTPSGAVPGRPVGTSTPITLMDTSFNLGGAGFIPITTTAESPTLHTPRPENDK